MSTLDAPALADVQTETAAAFHAGLAAAEPHHLDEDHRFHVLTPADGSGPVLIDLVERRQALAATPLRKKGAVAVHTAEALVDYVVRHHDASTEVWSDSETARIFAVLNGNAIDEPGHSDHTALLTLRKTDAWKAWEAASGKLGSQVALAELIEERAVDVVNPSSAVLLEVAQTFKGARSADFESSHRLSTGEVSFVYREQVAASAGKKGELAIPETFELALAPYEGSPTYKVIARLRYRISEGSLAIGFVLERPKDVLLAAFNDVRAEVENGVPEGTPVLAGWPR